MGRRLGVLSAVVALVATGCGGGGEKAKSGQATATTTATQGGAKPNELRVEAPAVQEKTFVSPAEIVGGVVTMSFKNAGKLKHEAILVGIGDKSEDEALSAVTTFTKEEGAAIPDFLEPAGGLGEVGPGETKTSTLFLPQGRYLIVCTLDDSDSQEGGGPEGEGESPPGQPAHFEQGMHKLLEVKGGEGASVANVAAKDGVVVGREYAFDVPALSPGPKELAFRNEGPNEIHVAALVQFPPGVDEAGAQQAFQALLQAQATGTPPPPGTPEPKEVAVSGVFAPNRGGTFTADLAAGHTYAVFCFIPDRAGGPPHFAKGMFRAFSMK